MDIQQLVQQLNWVDWGVVAIVLVTIVAGFREGFIGSALDLLGLAVSVSAAALGHQQIAALALQVVDVPKAVATLGAFLGLIVVVQLVYTTVVDLLLRLGRPLRVLLGPLRWVDRGLGVVPGAVKGLSYAALVLLPFTMFPLAPQVSAGIERSALASRLVSVVLRESQRFESLVGRELGEGLSLMVLTPPQTEQGMQLELGAVGQLEPDPGAEEQMLDLVNRERAKAGLPPLKPDERLREVARAHSLEMFKLGYIAHDSPVTGSPVDRIKQAGIDLTRTGENLAYAPNVQTAHENLMNSPAHRANILRPEFSRIGIGSIKSEFRGLMFSQEFGD
ncbi:MAG: CvpA family protein [Chloroflexi bacterium]|nr:CvpA family protein [Chloroflexota bacterium]